MSNNIMEPSDQSRALNIFVTEDDRTAMDIRAMSDFMTNKISSLTLDLIDRSQMHVTHVRPADIALVEQVLKSGKPVVQGEYEYLLDFDSLPKDILKKFREGKYRLGDSRQVKNNLRAVIVDETGIRVKDVTLRREKCTAATADTMQNIAIQVQLKQMDAKLDAILELQGYQIDFARNSTLVAPFFSARDRVVHAQNEPDTECRRYYLDEAVKMIEQAMNNIYLDIETIKGRFLFLTGWHIPFQEKVVNKYIGYTAQDLQLLARYNGVLLQILDFMGKKKDKLDAFEKYRRYMLGFYTKAVGRKRLPLALHIHNVFDAAQVQDKNIWKNMTDELVPVLQNTTAIQGALIISMEDEYK